MGETEFVLRLDISKMALLKALTEAEEGLFFMRVDENDKTARLISSDCMKTQAETYLTYLARFLEFKIIDVKHY